MILETKTVTVQRTRKSKLGVEHQYMRNKTVVVIRCDSCNCTFERDLGQMDHRRLDRAYTHVCSQCNQKQFAQQKGVERRRFWNIPVDTDLDIGKI
jgi:hypothetical protein